MRNTFLLLSAGLCLASTALAGNVTYPEAGKYYKIKHVSGLYLTDASFNATVTADAEDNSQVVQFVPVDGLEHTYNIVRVRRGQFYGSDKSYSSTIISRNVPLSQFEIVPSELLDGSYVTFKNVGLTSTKKKDKFLGTDDYTTDPLVYTDKDGTNEERHLWTIEEAKLYDETTETLPDVYPDNNIPDSDPRANAYQGYKLVFAEEFGGDGKPDSSIWSFEKGFKRNNEHQYYDGDNTCYLQDGVLVIEARDILSEERKNPSYNKHSSNWPSNIGQYLHWISGSMQTQTTWDGGYSWLYGIYEVRAKVPQMVGCWPAIWSTGTQYEWPYGGEIDILEYYGHAIHGNAAVGSGSRWGAKWNSAIISDSDLGEGWGDEYHTWRMYWDYDHMELWCDDLLVNNINLENTYNGVPTDSFDHGNGCNPFREVRQMMWLNLAIGGNNGGDPTSPVYPNRFIVDYARVYQKVGTDGKATYHVDPEVSEPTFTLKDGEANPAFPESSIDEISLVDGAKLPTKYFNLQGIEVTDPNNGIFIVQEGNSISKQIF